MKVYGWQGNRFECPPAANGGHQTREVVAAHSKAEAARLAGVNYPSQLFNLGESGNEHDAKIARSSPGSVFWQPLDFSRGNEEWHEAPPAKKCPAPVPRTPRVTLAVASERHEAQHRKLLLAPLEDLRARCAEAAQKNLQDWFIEPEEQDELRRTILSVPLEAKSG